MPDVRLACGRIVDSASQEWNDECRLRHQHVEALFALAGDENQQARVDYLRRIARREGDEMARRVKARVRKLLAEGRRA